MSSPYDVEANYRRARRERTVTTADLTAEHKFTRLELEEQIATLTGQLAAIDILLNADWVEWWNEIDHTDFDPFDSVEAVVAEFRAARESEGGS